MPRRPWLLLCALTLSFALAACGGGADDGGDSDAGGGAATTCDYTSSGGAAREVEPPPPTPTVSGEVAVTIATGAGDIPATLDAVAAPCTVGSFVSLAEQDYFDDIPCHRLTEGGSPSVLQCGDPTGSGTGGPGYSFPDELSGDETYDAATLAMANSGPDTNGSQFFIVYEDSQLPPDYTVFGTVDGAGIDVVRKVAADGTDNSNGPGDGGPNTPVQITDVTVG